MKRILATRANDTIKAEMAKGPQSPDPSPPPTSAADIMTAAATKLASVVEAVSNRLADPIAKKQQFDQRVATQVGGQFLCKWAAAGTCKFWPNCKFVHPNEQPPQQTNTTRESVCFQYRDTGKCTFGAACRFVHVPRAARQPGLAPAQACRKFLAGTCTFGSKCKYQHGKVAPSAPASGVAPQPRFAVQGLAVVQKSSQQCRDHTRGACTRGVACRYSHAAPCRDWERGSCARGEGCRYAHRA